MAGHTFLNICISSLEESYAVALATATAAGAQSEISFDKYVAGEVETMRLHGDDGFEEPMEGFKLFSTLLDMKLIGFHAGKVTKGPFFKGRRCKWPLAGILALGYRYHMDHATKPLHDTIPDLKTAAITLLQLPTASMGDAVAAWRLARDESDGGAAVRLLSSKAAEVKHRKCLGIVVVSFAQGSLLFFSPRVITQLYRSQLRLWRTTARSLDGY